MFAEGRFFMIPPSCLSFGCDGRLGKQEASSRAKLRKRHALDHKHGDRHGDNGPVIVEDFGQEGGGTLMGLFCSFQ